MSHKRQETDQLFQCSLTDLLNKFKNGPVPPHWTIDLHSCHQIPTGFELLLEKFFFSKLAPLIENISKYTFPRLFPGCFPGALFFSFSLFKIPTSIAREVCFFLNLLLLCRVFPGCFPGVSRVFPGRSQAQFSLSLFYFVKNPHSFCQTRYFNSKHQ